MPNGNPIARNPLLRKGGAHQHSRSTDRRQVREALNHAVEEWANEAERDDSEDDIALPPTTHLDSTRAISQGSDGAQEDTSRTGPARAGPGR